MYDELAEHYHLRYQDWEASIKRQAKILAPVLESTAEKGVRRLLDCACGVGTQSLGLAARGYEVVGADLSAPAVERARREAANRGLSIGFHVADMRDLSAVPGKFDAVLAADNALPHLMTDHDLVLALQSIRSKLREGGALVASLRDYDRLIRECPTIEPPTFFEGVDGVRRFSHQVWEWLAEDRYQLHMYMTVLEGERWRTLHFVSLYRALLWTQLEAAARTAGFADVRRIETAESEFYQPIAVIR